MTNECMGWVLLVTTSVWWELLRGNWSESEYELPIFYMFLEFFMRGVFLQR